MAIKICLFNHKGGVCKTTTAFNLGWMLAQKGKRVLLVDADSQCNLTNIFLTDDDFEAFYEEHPSQNIKSFLAPVFDGQAKPLKAAECVSDPRIANLFLLPGAFDLSEYDVSLGLSFSASQSITSLRNLPGSFNRLLEDTAKAYSADYTIVDLNPSLSSINQALLLSCDYFLIPAIPDHFSVMAIRSLSRILPRWEEWGKLARVMFKDSIYPFPTHTPKFLGSVIQRFGIQKNRQDAEKVPTKANRDIIKLINKTVAQNLVLALQKVDMLLPQENYALNYCIAQVQDYHSLNAAYHRFGTPVFSLSDEQIAQIGHGGKAKENDKGIIGEIQTSINTICDKILNLPHENKKTLAKTSRRRRSA